MCEPHSTGNRRRAVCSLVLLCNEECNLYLSAMARMSLQINIMVWNLLLQAHLASNLLPLVSTLPNSRATHGMSRYHNASTKFPDSLAHQESVAVRLHNGASHSRSGTVRLHDSVSRHDSGAARLVEILRDENASLKRELETYYQRVRKLMKVSPCNQLVTS